MKIMKIGLMLTFLVGWVSCSAPKKDKKYYSELLRIMEADAMSQLRGVNGSHAQARAVFMVIGDPANQTIGMAIKAKNLKPGKHAFHVHEYGDCTDNAKAAGNHWNPTKQIHGERGVDEQFHKGDIINLVAGMNGKAFWFGEIKGWTIGGDEETNILNKSLMIHAGPDNFVGQPGGNAGARILCGRIDLLIAEIERMKKLRRPFFTDSN